MRKQRIAAVVVLGALFLSTNLAGPARASCMELPPLAEAIDEAPYVFMGTVTALENSDRWATVRVEEIWKGDDFPEIVEVRAGPKDPPGPMSAASSVDRTFQLSERYLFLPYEQNGSVFSDNACTSTSRFRPSYERFAPEAPASPVPETDGPSGDEPAAAQEPDDSDERDLASILLSAGVLILLLAALLLYRRRAAR